MRIERNECFQPFTLEIDVKTIDSAMSLLELFNQAGPVGAERHITRTYERSFKWDSHGEVWQALREHLGE